MYIYFARLPCAREVGDKAMMKETLSVVFCLQCHSRDNQSVS